MKKSLNPEFLLGAYAAGIFPMAEHVDAEDIFWVDPEMRGVLPLDKFHLPRSLAKAIKKADLRITINQDFEGVMQSCRNHRDESWINDEIIRAYTGLHNIGHAHSIECWYEDRLVGGLYGVQLQAAFFGESMFSIRTNASKIALAYLVARLRYGDFKLLDCQFLTPHLAQFGVVEVIRGRYHTYLQEALNAEADFYRLPVNLKPSEVVQSLTQTS